jgi:xanthine dehydrogenase accessory factor
MTLKDLFTAVLEKTKAGEDTVLVTIVAEIGSSPRSAGTHMLADKDGRVCGTIGGGTLEYKAIELARNLLEQQKSRRKTYRLHRNDEEDLGMQCGGDVEVYFQFIAENDKKAIAIMTECLAALEKDEDVWLFTDLTNPADWSMALYRRNTVLQGMELGEDDIKALARNKGVMIKTVDRCIYGEPINFAGKVIIFGGGHCAQALQPLLTTVGFRCIVFDNREKFVTRELFPTAEDLIVGDYDAIYNKSAKRGQLTVNSSDYIVIMTHAYDAAVLRQILSKNCVYTGVIGSKGKIAAVKKQLGSEGIGEEVLDKINAPIGLKIRSETPEEIAISIAAEMILRRAELRSAAQVPVLSERTLF